jgi:drug/metabolite transporter, DME family
VGNDGIIRQGAPVGLEPGLQPRPEYGHANARLLVVTAAVLFSTGGAAIKWTTLTAWQVAGMRSLIAAAALLALLPDARKYWSRRGWTVGVVYAATLVLFVTANKLTTSANAIFLQAVAPVYILLAAPFVLGEHVTPKDVPFVVVMALGMAAFFVGSDVPVATAPNPRAGNLVAAASGVTYALTVMGLRAIARAEPRATLNTIVSGNLVAAAVSLPLGWPIEGAMPADWIVLTWLGVFQIGLAYLCLSKGVSAVTALEASLLLLAEPVLNPVWSWLVHGEHPGPWAIAGGLLIMAATTVRAVTAPSRP